MYKYLDKVRQKPDHHKKRFALMVSSTVTMAIFAVWSFVMFGVPSTGSVLADRSTERVSEEEHSPFESLRANTLSAFSSIKEDFAKVTETIKSIELESEYAEMRQDAIETYE